MSLRNEMIYRELLGKNSNATLSNGKEKKTSVNSNEFNFMNAVKETLVNDDEYNVSYTENGARGYSTTGKALVDINFQAASLRNKSLKEITGMFSKAFYEEPILAMKWLFYLRDVRGGMGERDSFRKIIKWIADDTSIEMEKLIPLIPQYGRYDDLWVLLDTELRDAVIEYVDHQLYADLQGVQKNKPITLLGKWMPSINTSSSETRELAKTLAKELGLSEKTYRQTLSTLRGYNKIVECDMSANRWENINYNAVPSKANVLYRNSFLRHDEERRRKWLEDFKADNGKAKVNAGTLFPHDIVNSYMNDASYYGGKLKQGSDDTLEEAWKALPDYVNGVSNVMVVADGSGSMLTRIDRNSSVTALNVANALAVYFSERSSGAYKDKYITFSSCPQYVDFSHCKTLREKISWALRYDECSNTNIEAVFQLILDTAKANHVTQREMPDTILIISDMEFDEGARSVWVRKGSGYPLDKKIVTPTLFNEIRERYSAAGYKLPRLAFWNVCSRSGTIPVRENDLGVTLVSGFSPAVVKMVLSNKTDPYECLVEQLNTERYKPIEDALIESYVTINI